MGGAVQLLFVFPYYAGHAVGPRVAAVLCLLGLGAGLWLGPREGRAARAGRGVLLAASAYVLGGLLALWPFNRALADFRAWYAKDAGLTIGMTRQDVSEALGKRGRFTVQPDGDWVVYDLEPGGLAGLHPLLGFADVDLYRLRVRYDAQTRVALEIARL